MKVRETPDIFRHLDLVDRLTNENPGNSDWVLFCLFVTLARHLAATGWTPDQLSGEAWYHANDQLE